MLEEYNVRIVQFKDKVEITKYGSPRLRGNIHLENTRDYKIDNSEQARKRRAEEQAFRIKRKIKYYVAENDFNLFWTLTFDDEKVNAKDYVYSRKRLQAWLKYQREKYGKFGYIFIPELHSTSNRIHFHGVTERFEPPLIQARSPKTNRLIKKKGIQIYNAPTWKNGFSTISEIQDKDRASNYISKYLSKELMEIPTAYNQPKYFVSRGLKLPTVSYETFTDEQLEAFAPSFVVGSLSEETAEYEADISIYNLDTSDGQYIQPNTPETVYKLKQKKKPSTEKLPHLPADDLTQI